MEEPAIVKDWLPRYTGMPLKDRGVYFCWSISAVTYALLPTSTMLRSMAPTAPCKTTTADNITIINFGIGSPNAGLIIDLLEAIKPKAVLFLGECGGLKNAEKPGWRSHSAHRRRQGRGDQ